MKLKEIINQNKEVFNEEISSKVDANFEKLLKHKLHQPKKGKLIYLKYSSVAACFALIFATFFWNKKQEEDKQQLLANLTADSAGTRLEGVYHFNDSYAKEDVNIIDTLIKILHKDANANVKIATIDALLKFPTNEKIRTNLIKAIENEKLPLVQIKLIKSLSFLRENRAQKPLEKIINNEQTYPIVKNNATLAMANLKQ